MHTGIHPPLPRADTLPPGSRPREAVHAGIRATSGRYTFYWNAYLLFLFINRETFMLNCLCFQFEVEQDKCPCSGVFHRNDLCGPAYRGSTRYKKSSFFFTSSQILSHVYQSDFMNPQIWQYCHYCQLLFPYICSFLLNMCHVILVNVKLYISMYRRVIFQGYRFFGILIISSGTAKQSWQYWHSCIVESLLKTIMGFFIIFV